MVWGGGGKGGGWVVLGLWVFLCRPLVPKRALCFIGGGWGGVGGGGGGGPSKPKLRQPPSQHLPHLSGGGNQINLTAGRTLENSALAGLGS